MLEALPAVFALVGLVAYAVLAGADFGAGAWALASGGGEDGARLRDHARHAMGPVWEANHVWLIFVLVVLWTGYPVAFGSIASTLAVPLFLAAVGIILRGTAYALRGTADGAREQSGLERLLGISSLLTPFALGAAAGGIASGRVPVGNAAGDAWASWLNPTSAVLGALLVASGAYLAAVYLTADARRVGEPELERAFARRARGAGLVAGALAVGALVVVRSDAAPLWHGLTHGAGIAALIASGLGGVGTLVLLAAGRLEAARVAAALAVAAIVAGWALAQQPRLLPGLTVDQAAAGHATLVALVIAVGAGSVILVPALGLLFALFLRGGFDPGAPGRAAAAALRPARPRAPLPLVVPLGLAAVGVVLNVVFDPAWTRVLGLAALLGFCATAFGRLTRTGEPEG